MWFQETWVLGLALSLTHCMILGPLFLFFGPQFPHLYNEDNNDLHTILTGHYKDD